MTKIIAKTPIMKTIRTILDMDEVGKSLYKYVHGGPWKENSEYKDTYKSEKDIQIAELEVAFKNLGLRDVPSDTPFIEGISAFKQTFEFARFKEIGSGRFNRDGKPTKHPLALLNALEAIRVFYRESNKNQIYLDKSELLGMRDIFYVVGEYKQNLPKSKDIKFAFSTWSGETETWPWFKLEVEATVESLGFPELLRYNPKDRLSKMGLLAIESTDALFYLALIKAVHGHESNKQCRLDLFMETRWSKRNRLQGSAVWHLFTLWFDTDRAKTLRNQILADEIDKIRLDKSDGFNPNSAKANNLSALISLVPMFKDNMPDMDSNQLTALMDGFDKEAMRSQSISTVREFREVRMSSGGLKKQAYLQTPSFGKGDPFKNKGLVPNDSVSLRRIGAPNWPLGKKEDSEENSPPSWKKKYLGKGKNVTFADNPSKATDDKLAVGKNKAGDKGASKAIRVHPKVYSKLKPVDKKLLKEGKKSDLVLALESLLEDATKVDETTGKDDTKQDPAKADKSKGQEKNGRKNKSNKRKGGNPKNKSNKKLKLKANRLNVDLQEELDNHLLH